MLRGGWGAYRFVTQVNDVSAPLVTAQHVLGYNLPGQQDCHAFATLNNWHISPARRNAASGSQTGLRSKRLWSAAHLCLQLHDRPEAQVEYRARSGLRRKQHQPASRTTARALKAATIAALADQNKTPIGAFFNPDPVTGVRSTNPENLGTNPNGMGGTPTGNTAADYHPYGFAYGTASAYMNQSTAYTNYNGLQVAWIKTAGKLGLQPERYLVEDAGHGSAVQSVRSST